MRRLEPLEQLPAGAPRLGFEPTVQLFRDPDQRIGTPPLALRLCGRLRRRSRLTFRPDRPQAGEELLERRGPPKRSVGRSRSGGAVAVSLPSPARDGVPGSWAFSRFLAGVTRLEDETAAVSGMAAPDGGAAGLRAAPGLRRQGGRQPFDRARGREERQDVRSGRGLGEARDAWRGPARGQGVDEGEDVVRLRPASDRRRRARDSGVVRGDGGVALGAQGAVGGAGRAVRGRAGAGGAVRGLLRRPGPRRAGR